MDGGIEIRYAGVVIGRGALQAEGAGGFVAFADPLPVGTECELELPNGRRRVRVEHVVERGSGPETGMHVRYVGDGETAGVPEQVEPETSSRPVGAADEPPAVTSRSTIAYGVTAADLAGGDHRNPEANGKPAVTPASGTPTQQQQRGNKKKRR